MQRRIISLYFGKFAILAAVCGMHPLIIVHNINGMHKNLPCNTAVMGLLALDTVTLGGGVDPALDVPLPLVIACVYVGN